VDSAQLVRQVDIGGNSPFVVFTSDGRSLATAAAGKDIVLWDVATGKEIRRFTGHDSGVTSFALSAGWFTGSFRRN
jgi:WD40 repeat protein